MPWTQHVSLPTGTSGIASCPAIPGRPIAQRPRSLPSALNGSETQPGPDSDRHHKFSSTTAAQQHPPSRGNTHARTDVFSIHIHRHTTVHSLLTSVKSTAPFLHILAPSDLASRPCLSAWRPRKNPSSPVLLLLKSGPRNTHPQG